jgi:nitrate reductase gamma subunit
MTQDAHETAGWRLSAGSWFVLGGGVAIFCMGVPVFVLANPSPHGYTEIFVVIPTMSVGAAIAAFGLLMSRRRLVRPVRILAWLLLLGSLAPLASIAHLLVRTQP